MPRTVAPPSDRSFGFTFAVGLCRNCDLARVGEPIHRSDNFHSIGDAHTGHHAASPVSSKSAQPGVDEVWGGPACRGNPIVLGAIYFVVIAPIGIAMRLAGRDSLRRRLDASARSYWIDRQPPGPPPRLAPSSVLGLHGIPTRVVPVPDGAQEVLAPTDHHWCCSAAYSYLRRAPRSRPSFTLF